MYVLHSHEYVAGMKTNEDTKANPCSDLTEEPDYICIKIANIVTTV